MKTITRGRNRVGGLLLGGAAVGAALATVFLVARPATRRPRMTELDPNQAAVVTAARERVVGDAKESPA